MRDNISNNPIKQLFSARSEDESKKSLSDIVKLHEYHDRLKAAKQIEESAKVIEITLNKSKEKNG